MEAELKKEDGFEYIEKGEGPVIVLLHGLFGALSNFKDVLNTFSQKYRVVIPILPIYKLPLLNTNVKNLASFLKDFMDFKGIKKATLLGNSLGGHVALVHASLYPETVQSMILTGSSGLYENSSMGGTFPRREDYNFIKEKVAYTFYDPENATKELVDEVYEIVNDKGKLIRILSLAKSAIRHNMAEELPKMKMPVCLIWGKQDTITPPDVAEEFQRLFPAADLFWIDKCGHAPMMERPHEFNQVLTPWLDKNLTS